MLSDAAKNERRNMYMLKKIREGLCNHEVRTPKSESRSAFKLPAIVKPYGSTKKITRAAFLARKKIEQDIVETDQLAKPYYRWGGQIYKQRQSPIPSLLFRNPLYIEKDEWKYCPHYIEKDMAKMDNTTMPYKIWPRKAPNFSIGDFEVDRHDTFIKMETEYYEKMAKLSRRIWNVVRPDNEKKLDKLPKIVKEVILTQPQGPMRNTKHVELDFSEVKHFPDESDAMRMKHAIKSLNKLRTKTMECTAYVEKKTCKSKKK